MSAVVATMVGLDDCYRWIAHDLRVSRDDLIDRNATLRCENARLQAENERLKRELEFERGRGR